MTARLPVVVHSATGLPCIVNDGVNGYVVDVQDTQAYSQALLALLRDADLRQHMGSAGHQRALSHFSQAEVATRLFSVFAATLGIPVPLKHLPVEVIPLGIRRKKG
jgi:glycosyltransferase involved in cell wall biosynthesis